jgi:exosome complex RNA-binding protein Rrp4
MAKDEMRDLAEKIGKLTGTMEGVIKSNDHNTAEIKQFNAYMHKSIGATEERDKHYKRVKHGTMASIIMAFGACLKTFIGH